MTRDQFERLLECEPFLRALARRLLRGDPRADDVVQEAWLLALRDGRGEVRPGYWAGVVRNLARRVRRDDARRARRERVAARPEEIDAAAPGAEEARRRLVAEVLALPERYRVPILLRFYEGLEPQAIAARLGENASTIRTRLQRGLDRLRGVLDGRLCLAVLAWRPARRVAPAVAATLVAIAVTAWLVLDGAPARPERANPHAALRGAATRSADEPAELVAARGNAPAAEISAPRFLRVETQLFPGALTRAVRVEVTGAEGGCADAVVDGHDRLAIDRLRGALRVQATHPEARPCVVTLPAGAERVTLTLHRRALVPDEDVQEAEPPTAAELAAVAVAEAGLAGPSAGPRPDREEGDARLHGIVHLPADVEPARVRLQVARDERILLADVPPERAFAVAVDTLLAGEPPAVLRVTAWHAGTRPARVDVAVGPGGRVAPLVLTLERARVVRGVVTLEGEGPGAGVTVAAWRPEAGPAPDAVATTDAGGAFTLALDPHGGYVIGAVAPGWQPGGTPLSGTRDEQDLQLVLGRGLAITGHAPVPGAPLRAGRADGETASAGAATLALGEARLRWGTGRLAWHLQATRADAAGQYALGGLEAVEYAVTCGEETVRAVPPAVVDFETPPVRLDVVVRTGAAPVADARVTVDGLERWTDAEGRATFDLLAAPSYRVTVEAPGHAPQTRTVKGTPAEFDVGLMGEQAELAIVLETPRDGPALPAACLVELSGPAGAALRRTVARDGDGLLVVSDLPPGSYVVAVEPGGWYLPAAAAAWLRARERTEVRLPLEAGGRVKLAFQGPDGQPALATAFVETVLAGAGGTAAAPATGWLSPLLPPGLHFVMVMPADPLYLPAYEAVEVRAGVTDAYQTTLLAWSDAKGADLPGLQPPKGDLIYAPQMR